MKKQEYQTTESTFTPTFGSQGKREREFRDWERRNQEKQIYKWIDTTLQKAGVKIPGKHPGKTPQLGGRIESSLHSSLRKAVNKYLGTITEENSQQEILNGVMDTVHQWSDSVEKDTDKFITELFTRGFVAGAVDAGVEPTFGKIDKMALNFLKTNPKRIGSTIKTFSQDVIKEFENIIAKSYGPEGEFSLYGLTKEMGAVVNSKRWQLERIARTETASVSNGGRLYAWNQDKDKYLYKYLWNSAVDNRSKKISLKRHMGNPYSFSEIDYLWNNQAEMIDGKLINDVYNQRCSISRSPIEKELDEFRFAGLEKNYMRTA